jgi:hypothetical protein
MTEGDEMTDEPTPPKRQSGGRWKRGMGSPNPGGRKKPKPAMPPPAQSVNTEEKRDTRFKVGNPGRPLGSRNRATLAALAIMEGEAEEISRKAVELAKSGDLTAIRLVLERLVSPARGRPVTIALPRMNTVSDLVAAADAITASVSDGTLTPDEGASISTLISNTAKAVEVAELSERIARLEAAHAGKSDT